MKTWIKSLSVAVLTALCLLKAGGLAQASEPDKVVYHIDDAVTQATKGLRNIRNHLDTVPNTKIVVVTHANGVDFLFDGAKDAKNPGVDYGALVSSLK
ncbi:MAG: hypothetical protein EBY76_10865, partial [Betaproteobacteria bacterium]|nr:hypothetical protein [Betaproteobacteria bacterium]